RMSKSEFPFWRADHPRVFKFMIDDVLPGYVFSAKRFRKAFSWRLGRGGHFLFQTEIIEHGWQEIVIFDHKVADFSRSNMAGIAEDQGDLHGGFMRIDRTGMIAHAPIASVAGIQSLVVAEDVELGSIH